MNVGSSTGQQVFPTLGSQRTGISSFTFLKIGVNPRATALGESFVAIADDASSLYWNPAGTALTTTNEAMFSQTFWFADIAHVFAGITYHLTQSDAVGLSVISLYTDPIDVTTDVMPFGTGQSYSYSDIAIGLTYARKMTEQFSFGVTTRYLNERIAEVTLQNLVFDLGIHYYTGFSSTRFAIVLSNFGSSSKTTGSVHPSSGVQVSTFEEFLPPTMFRIGFAFEPIDIADHQVTSSIQLNHPNDSGENVSFGIEYAWNQSFFLRVGYRLDVEEQPYPSFGIGGAMYPGNSRLQFDYSAVPFRILGVVHRISFAVRMSD
ncbi:MAG: PorV/PorQ family protein [Ignavibacteriales bacterium]|nr:PorV/PorQ family protein [Ignavibacteriales bacterium]